MSQNKNINNAVASPDVKHSGFPMPSTHVTSFNFGEIIPVYVEPTLPGSRWKMSTEWLLKTAAMIAPAYTHIRAYIHTFYVPYRLLWPGFTDFITETKEGGVLPAAPFITMAQASGIPADKPTRLDNYMGIPFSGSILGTDKDEQVTAFWWAAYQMIWNEYYRDQNLQDEVPFELVDGDNASIRQELSTLRLRNWMHDYFTSGLPDTQKGAAVNIPMLFTDVKVGIMQDTPPTGDTLGVITTNNLPSATPGVAGAFIGNTDVPGATVGTMFADTSQLTGNAPIIALRTAEQLQVFRETMMTHGSRYNEYLEAIYGYKIHDLTVQRPVYLGGSVSTVNISETLNTAGNQDLNIPQGNKSGNGNSYGNGGEIDYLCGEHGVIMSLMTVMPDALYWQGIRKEFKKFDPFDYGNPLMANIGEQPIKKSEIYAFVDHPSPDFAYQQRYAEYKQSINRISGDMQNTLIFWNQARIFNAPPVLNSQFIQCDADEDDLNRIFNIEDESSQKLWVMIRTDAYVKQPLPYFGTPTLSP